MIGNGAPHRLICFFDLQVCGTSNDVIGNHSVEIELDDTNIFFQRQIMVAESGP